MNIQEFRCHACQKKLFEGNLPLLLQKKYTSAGEAPRIEHRCPRCKALNVFTLADAALTIAK
jgi:phage FluMu protein Com